MLCNRLLNAFEKHLLPGDSELLPEIYRIRLEEGEDSMQLVECLQKELDQAQQS